MEYLYMLPCYYTKNTSAVFKKKIITSHTVPVMILYIRTIFTSTFCFNWMQNKSVITSFKTNLLKNWLLWSAIKILGPLMFPFWQDQPLICCTTHKVEVVLPFVSLGPLGQANWNFMLVWNVFLLFFFKLWAWLCFRVVVVLQCFWEMDVVKKYWLESNATWYCQRQHAPEEPEGTK